MIKSLFTSSYFLLGTSVPDISGIRNTLGRFPSALTLVSWLHTFTDQLQKFLWAFKTESSTLKAEFLSAGEIYQSFKHGGFLCIAPKFFSDRDIINEPTAGDLSAGIFLLTFLLICCAIITSPHRSQADTVNVLTNTPAEIWMKHHYQTKHRDLQRST